LHADTRVISARDGGFSQFGLELERQYFKEEVKRFNDTFPEVEFENYRNSLLGFAAVQMSRIQNAYNNQNLTGEQKK